MTEAKVVTIYTTKGGVGKTTTAIHLADYLHSKGHKVALIDADERGMLSEAIMGSEGNLPFPTLVLREPGWRRGYGSGAGDDRFDDRYHLKRLRMATIMSSSIAADTTRKLRWRRRQLRISPSYPPTQGASIWCKPSRFTGRSRGLLNKWGALEFLRPHRARQSCDNALCWLPGCTERSGHQDIRQRCSDLHRNLRGDLHERLNFQASPELTRSGLHAAIC